MLKQIIKSKQSIFDEIFKCPKCISNAVLCDTHARIVKDVLIQDTKRMIEKMI